MWNVKVTVIPIVIKRLVKGKEHHPVNFFLFSYCGRKTTVREKKKQTFGRESYCVSE